MWGEEWGECSEQRHLEAYSSAGRVGEDVDAGSLGRQKQHRDPELLRLRKKTGQVKKNIAITMNIC